MKNNLQQKNASDKQIQSSMFQISTNTNKLHYILLFL